MVDVYGEGPPVVLLHGFTSSGDSWRRHGWVDLLVESGFRTIVPDFPGHGRSEPADDVSTATLASMVAGLVDERASFVGFSMGAGVALQVATDFPARVDKLVVGGIGDAAIVHLHDPADIDELHRAFSGERAAANAERIRRNAELAGNDPAALLPYLEQGGWPGGVRELAVEAPVLLIRAARDEYMRGDAALLDRLGRVDVVECAGGHHDVLRDDAVKQAAVAFLR